MKHGHRRKAKAVLPVTGCLRQANRVSGLTNRTTSGEPQTATAGCISYTVLWRNRMKNLST